MKNLVSLLLLAIFSLPAFSQSISIFDIDTTNFPTMKAKFYAFDKDGNIQRPSANELTLKENGVVRTISTTSCPSQIPLQTVSVAMSIDVSGSMGYSEFNELPVELGKLTAIELCKAMSMPPSSFALQTCNDRAYIINDFTTDKNIILNNIPKIKAGGNNDFVEHLQNKITGLLNLVKTGENKRVAVLYTDAWWYALTPSELKSCLDTCKKYNIEFYTVIYSRKEAEPNGIKSSLNELCTKTGGVLFDGITSTQAAQNIASHIQKIIQGATPCELSWISDISCKNVTKLVELNWQSQSATSSYVPSRKSLVNINLTPRFIAFGGRTQFAQTDTTITISSPNLDLNIIGIKRIFGSDNFIVTNNTFPIFIPKNTSKVITLRFTPKDSSLKYAAFEIETDICSANFSANGGFPGKKVVNPTMKLLYPNGGEEFVVGSDTIISWEGISKNDTVTLEYSIDSGRSWKNITEKGTDLKYKWLNIPFPTSTKCLMKVSQNQNGLPDYNEVLSIKQENKWSYLANFAISPNGDQLAAVDFNQINIWDVKSGKKIQNSPINNKLSNYMTIKYNNEGNQIALITDTRPSTIIFWDLISNKFINQITLDSFALDFLSISPDDKYISTVTRVGNKNGKIKIYDISKNVLIKEFEIDTNTREISYSSNWSQFVTMNVYNNVKIWDASSGNFITQLEGRHNSIVYSPDCTKIATSSIDSTIKIWDAYSGKLIVNLKINRGQVWNDEISFNPDGNKLAIGGDDNGYISIWDLENGNMLKKIPVDYYKYDVRKVEFSPNGHELVTLSADTTIRVLNLNFLFPLQSDISDSVFSIVAPTPLGRNVDMKECLVAAVKDSVVSDFMQNVGSYRLRTDSIYFSGADASAFQLVSGIPRYELEPGKTKFAELRFMPKRTGYHSARINIITGGKILIYYITGIGVQPMLQVVNNIIDFGKIKVGASKDTIQVNTIKNTGIGPITITKTLHAAPNDVDFTTLSGSAPFTLQPGETAKMNLRFNAKSRGRTSGQLKFEYNGVGSPAVVQLFAEGLPADTNCEGRSFVFRNFNLTSQVVKNGNSFITPDSTVRLTESKSNEVGGISYSEKVSLLSSFVMKFSFRFSNGVNSFMDGSLPGADGIAVLFQNGRGFRTTENGGSLGYNGIINCVALEMDMYRNSDFNDPNGNHVALQIPYRDTITSEHNAQRTFKMNENIFVLRPDSTVYYGVVKFDANKKHLYFYLDSNKSANNLVMSVDDFDFSRHLKLEYGDFAYIGITGSTGASVQTHEILSWEFCSDRDEVLSVENGFYESEELVQSDNTISLSKGQIKSIKIIDFLGKTIFEEEVNTAKIDINKYNLSTGMYYIIAKDEMGRSYFKKVSLIK